MHDFSFLAATYFGAADKPEVKAWSRPVLDAYLAGAWFVIWTANTVFWVAKPTVKVEGIGAARRLHCEDGPACANEIENLYFWHGVRVPAHVILCPDAITLDEIETEQNQEIRRIMIERHGWQKYLKAANATVKDRRRNDIEGTSEALMATDKNTVLVCACPSTGRVYALEVPNTITTCAAAQEFLSGGLSRRIIAAS
jgi:hypothetical protein